jgi:hypothetical protein
MWIPEIIFCVAAQCWEAQAAPHDTQASCSAYMVETMAPTILAAVPNSRIRALRCAPPPGEPA